MNSMEVSLALSIEEDIIFLANSLVVQLTLQKQKWLFIFMTAVS